jgi:hypothetical protein
MSTDPHASFDQTVLDVIEHSPTGAVPHTPAYQDALKRLRTSHQVYADADHKDGYVTARSLAKRPLFHANNLDALIAGRITPDKLEADASIFARYVQSLPPAQRPQAEAYRSRVVGRPVHHRAKHDEAVVHDPVHTLFLVPGAGVNPGLPGNYLYGSVFETAAAGWGVQLHDRDDGLSVCVAPDLAAALAKLQEVLESAPFLMSELEAFGFQAK